MAHYTKKDFALLCGVKTNYLSNYIKRGKIILTGKFIDNKHPANAAFLQKYSEKAKNIIVLPDEKTKTDKEPDKGKMNLNQYGIDLEIKKADLAKKLADKEYRQLQIDKITGNSIPVDLVQSMIYVLNKTFITVFKDGADSFLIEISKRKSISIHETAELKGLLIKIINLASQKTTIESKREMKIIVNNYSDQRAVGEHG